jgi:hypothetical protein
MDDHRVFTFKVENTNLEKSPISSRPYEHRDLVNVEAANSVAGGVEHVRVRHIMLASRIGNAHVDNVACRSGADKVRCLSQEADRFSQKPEVGTPLSTSQRHIAMAFAISFAGATLSKSADDRVPDQSL